MAEYTITLRRIIETDEGKNIIEKALSTYPLYEGKKPYDLIPTREELNQRLLGAYKYREIGFDTVGRFADELEIAMCEIMPRYNEWFKTVETMADLENPFDNVDVTETFEQTRTDSSSSEGTSTSSASSTGTQNGSSSSERNTEASSAQTANGKHIESDTPQDSLTIGSKDIDSVDYASKAGWNEDGLESENTSKETDTATTENETTSTSTGSGTNTASSESESVVSHTFRKKGNYGVNTFAHDMLKWRETIVNVTEKIIRDRRIQELFMLVY